MNPEVDPELEEIVKRGLAKDFKKRTKSADQLENELRRHISRKFPEFSPQDLGNFLKQNLEAKIAACQACDRAGTAGTCTNDHAQRRQLSSA